MRQVSGAIAGNRRVPRQTDVKVRIEGPLPVAPNFVVQIPANLADHPCLDFRRKRRLEQAGVRRAPIREEAGNLVSPRRECL